MVNVLAAASVSPRLLVLSAMTQNDIMPTKAQAYTITVKSCVSSLEYPKPYGASQP